MSAIEAPWRVQHFAAINAPRGDEREIVNLMSTLANVAGKWKGDGFMNDALIHIGEAIRVLLNGDVGRLDPGLVNQFVDHVIDPESTFSR